MRSIVATAVLVGGGCGMKAREVSVGVTFTCILDLDGYTQCWGPIQPPFELPAMPLATIDVGGATANVGWGSFWSMESRQWYSACGLETNGQLHCWGTEAGVNDAPAGAFTQVTVGGTHACALRADHTVACWGDPTNGQTSPPSSRFVQISAGGWGTPSALAYEFHEGHTCGVREDHTIECWGANGERQSEPPPGEFAAVTTGSYYACALRDDGTVACWGDQAARWELPVARFRQIDAGEEHVCGIRACNSTVECWGDNANGKATPPGGEFASVSAGRGGTCALTATSDVICWGK